MARRGFRALTLLIRARGARRWRLSWNGFEALGLRMTSSAIGGGGAFLSLGNAAK